MKARTSLGGKIGRVRLRLRERTCFLIVTSALLTLVVAACADETQEPEAVEEDPVEEAIANDDLSTVERVDQLVELIGSPDSDVLHGEAIEIEAWISPPPKTEGLPSSPPQGCPVVPESLDWLTDDPVHTQISVAGATLPNRRLQSEIPILRLVVPYQLGFVDIPERARLRGYVLDNDHAGCPQNETFFVLDTIVDELPADQQTDPDDVIAEWAGWSHSESGLRAGNRISRWLGDRRARHRPVRSAAFRRSGALSLGPLRYPGRRDLLARRCRRQRLDANNPQGRSS